MPPGPINDQLCDVVLRDGSTLPLRPAGQDDTGALVTFFAGLSPESRYYRFFGVSNMDPARVAGLIPVETTAGAALVGECGGRIVAFAGYYSNRLQRAASNAVQLAAELAHELSVPLVITHVVTPVVVPTQWQLYVDVAGEERVTQARERLDKWLRDLPTRIQGEVVVEVARPADSIASTAAEKGAGLIVMGLFWRQRRVRSEARLNCVPSSVRLEGSSAGGRAPN